MYEPGGRMELLTGRARLRIGWLGRLVPQIECARYPWPACSSYIKSRKRQRHRKIPDGRT